MSKKIILELKDIYLTYSFVKSMSFKDFMLQSKKRIKYKFEALRGITFNLEQGVNLGVIGSNGSGKSTLLRILANTLIPDSGKIINHAKSMSLLSLGVGFNNELSGIENIYLNGLLLGLTKKEIDKKIDEIIDFSEIGDFIFNPIKTYSSGMKSKLSFSIAINVNPELLLIDEIFSVGDEKFRKKSKEKMESMLLDDRTVVYISHSMGMIKQYCQKVLWIENGQIQGFGASDEVIGSYLDYSPKSSIRNNIK